MNQFVIMTDASCDLPLKMIKEFDLVVLPLSVTIKDQEYYSFQDERSIKFKDFYQMIRDGYQAKTSALNVDMFINKMEKILLEGKDIIYLAFSSGLSNTFNIACIAAKELSEKYPNRKIYIVDTLCASLGQGLLVYLAAQQKQNGKNIDEVKDFVETTKFNICHIFTVDDLEHLKRGGRISSTKATFGTMLKIKPILHIDDEGHLINISKSRGRKESLINIVKYMENKAKNIEDQTIFISHGDCIEDAEYVKKLIEENIKVKDIIINYVGISIGAHSGPGTMALFFLGNKR